MSIWRVMMLVFAVNAVMAIPLVLACGRLRFRLQLKEYEVEWLKEQHKRETAELEANYQAELCRTQLLEFQVHKERELRILYEAMQTGGEESK